MNFAESEAYLLSLGNEVLAMKLGLANIQKLLAALGNPQNNYQKVQVAGTNGKGSVCAFLESICREAKIRTGVFTSPHLISVTERVRIDGVQISEDEFAKYATLVRSASERLLEGGSLQTRPTFFEHLTAIGLAAFFEHAVDLAILETGLGGRLDATTAANAQIVALTQIDLDHQAILGDTLEEIAAEKAAIIHERTIVIAASQHTTVEDVIDRRCAEVGVKPIWADTDLGHSIGLKGKHQRSNAGVAVAVAKALRSHGFAISNSDIEKGLAAPYHPGRLQYVDGVLLDGAHNIAAAKALRCFLDEEVTGDLTLIFGAMKDKDVKAMTEILFPSASTLILTKPNNARAMPVSTLAEFARNLEEGHRVIFASLVGEALTIARELSSRESTIVVTGSLYLVGEALEILNN